MSKKIRVAVVGVGNCANSFMQGLVHYRGVNGTDPVMGLVRPMLGGYHVRDIEVVAAFDVTQEKVGRDLAEAAWAFPNKTYHFAQLEPSGVEVLRGPTLDGRGKYFNQEKWGSESAAKPVDVVRELQRADVDVVVNYLPVGSQEAAELYAEAALSAGCAMVNCIPVFLASHPDWAQSFKDAGLPIVGDDIKSQVGATIVHRVLAHLFKDRGVQLDRTYQLNVGGNGDFLNMLERERLDSKKTSKTNAVISVAGPMAKGDVHIGPSDYVSWLNDKKIAHIRMEGRGFGGAPIQLDLKLEVEDSPNSAGIVIDAVRCAMLAKDRGEGGPVHPASTYFMKSPARQIEDGQGLKDLEEWIGKEGNHG